MNNQLIASEEIPSTEIVNNWDHENAPGFFMAGKSPFRK